MVHGSGPLCADQGWTANQAHTGTQISFEIRSKPIFCSKNAKCIADQEWTCSQAHPEVQVPFEIRAKAIFFSKKAKFIERIDSNFEFESLIWLVPYFLSFVLIIPAVQ